MFKLWIYFVTYKYWIRLTFAINLQRMCIVLHLQHQNRCHIIVHCNTILFLKINLSIICCDARTSQSLHKKNALLLHSSWSFFILLNCHPIPCFAPKISNSSQLCKHICVLVYQLSLLLLIDVECYPISFFLFKSMHTCANSQFCFNICYCRNLYRIFFFLDC
jgi:hypothetical protein